MADAPRRSATNALASRQLGDQQRSERNGLVHSPPSAIRLERSAVSAPHDGTALRNAFATFPSGVTAVCALNEGRPIGLAASSFTSVSIDPPLVSVCIAKASTTWPTLSTAPTLGISVLAEGHGDLTRTLASKTADRFASAAWVADASGAVFIDGAPLWLACRLTDQVAAGDHYIVVLEIVEMSVLDDVPPLVFHGSKFRRLA